MHTLMLDNTAANICLQFIKIKYVNEQPQFKVTYYDNQALNKLNSGALMMNQGSRNL
jgi:hypothetical protein